MKNHNSSVGRMGEAAAEQYLLDHGYCVLARRFRVARGEIDLIVEKDDTIVFVEVKTRNSQRFGRASEAVTFRKQQTMTAVAQQYLMDNNRLNDNVRFDVIEVYPRENRIHHIPDVFFARVQ